MLSFIVLALYVITILIVISLIFVERRSVQSTVGWVIVLVSLPVVGLCIYILFGRRFLKDRKLVLKKNEDTAIKYNVVNMSSDLNSLSSTEEINHIDMIKMFNNLGACPLTSGNKVDMYFESEDFFNSLINALEQAKKSINIQFYIFKNDEIGNKIIHILERKQREGVKVKLLYDAMGSRSVSNKDFEILRAYGGEVAAFLPSKIKLLNVNLNYRNHRKLVIIDGDTNALSDSKENNTQSIGFIGGFNIGDEYLGKYKKFGTWRDTHVKILGPAVKYMNIRFLLDWRFAANKDIDLSEYIQAPIKECGDVSLQIVSSGPDMNTEEIKYGYIKMIQDAKKYIYIQSPYLILDNSLLEALKMACYRGVDVKIMIPAKPDHPFVYWANHSYAGELLQLGANIYKYSKEAFIHSKTVAIDDEVCSIGTANMDIRSFALNFEVNAFIYSKDITIKQKAQFEKDIELSEQLTTTMYDNRSKIVRVKESISRLLSPIL